MNRDRVEGRVRQFVGAFREWRGKLIGDQTLQIRGEHDRLSGRMQVGYGVTRDTTLLRNDKNDERPR